MRVAPATTCALVTMAPSERTINPDPRPAAERWPASGLDPAKVTTNIVAFEHPHPMKLIAHLESEGIRAGTLAPGVVRFATHLDVDDAGIERAVRAVASAP